MKEYHAIISAISFAFWQESLIAGCFLFNLFLFVIYLKESINKNV